MATDLFPEAIKRKGIAEHYGKIETASFYSEGKGTVKDILIIPEYREITCLADFFAILNEIQLIHHMS